MSLLKSAYKISSLFYHVSPHMWLSGSTVRLLCCAVNGCVRAAFPEESFNYMYAAILNSIANNASEPLQDSLSLNEEGGSQSSAQLQPENPFHWLFSAQIPAVPPPLHPQQAIPANSFEYPGSSNNLRNSELNAHTESTARNSNHAAEQPEYTHQPLLNPPTTPSPDIIKPKDIPLQEFLNKLKDNADPSESFRLQIRKDAAEQQLLAIPYRFNNSLYIFDKLIPFPAPPSRLNLSNQPFKAATQFCYKSVMSRSFNINQPNQTEQHTHGRNPTAYTTQTPPRTSPPLQHPLSTNYLLNDFPLRRDFLKLEHQRTNTAVNTYEITEPPQKENHEYELALPPHFLDSLSCYRNISRGITSKFNLNLLESHARLIKQALSSQHPSKSTAETAEAANAPHQRHRLPFNYNEASSTDLNNLRNVLTIQLITNGLIKYIPINYATHFMKVNIDDIALLIVHLLHPTRLSIFPDFLSFLYDQVYKRNPVNEKEDARLKHALILRNLPVALLIAYPRGAPALLRILETQLKEFLPAVQKISREMKVKLDNPYGCAAPGVDVYALVSEEESTQLSIFWHTAVVVAALHSLNEIQENPEYLEYVIQKEAMQASKLINMPERMKNIRNNTKSYLMKYFSHNFIGESEKCGEIFKFMRCLPVDAVQTVSWECWYVILSSLQLVLPQPEFCAFVIARTPPALTMNILNSNLFHAHIRCLVIRFWICLLLPHTDAILENIVSLFYLYDKRLSGVFRKLPAYLLARIPENVKESLSKYLLLNNRVPRKGMAPALDGTDGSDEGFQHSGSAGVAGSPPSNDQEGSQEILNQPIKRKRKVKISSSEEESTNNEENSEETHSEHTSTDMKSPAEPVNIQMILSNPENLQLLSWPSHFQWLLYFTRQKQEYLSNDEVTLLLANINCIYTLGQLIYEMNCQQLGTHSPPISGYVLPQASLTRKGLLKIFALNSNGHFIKAIKETQEESAAASASNKESNSDLTDHEKRQRKGNHPWAWIPSNYEFLTKAPQFIFKQILPRCLELLIHCEPSPARSQATRAVGFILGARWFNSAMNSLLSALNSVADELRTQNLVVFNDRREHIQGSTSAVDAINQPNAVYSATEEREGKSMALQAHVEDQPNKAMFSCYFTLKSNRNQKISYSALTKRITALCALQNIDLLSYLRILKNLNKLTLKLLSETKYTINTFTGTKNITALLLHTIGLDLQNLPFNYVITETNLKEIPKSSQPSEISEETFKLFKDLQNSESFSEDTAKNILINACYHYIYVISSSTFMNDWAHIFQWAITHPAIITRLSPDLQESLRKTGEVIAATNQKIKKWPKRIYKPQITNAPALNNSTETFYARISSSKQIILKSLSESLFYLGEGENKQEQTNKNFIALNTKVNAKNKICCRPEQTRKRARKSTAREE